jgi:hypothetical protein
MLEGEHRAELLENLSGVISGPEFRTEYDTPGGRPRCTLRIAFPRVGGPTGLAINAPGTIRSYRAAWDSDEMRTRTYAVGDLPEGAPETDPLPVEVEDRPQADLPRLDKADQWPGVILRSTLRERAVTRATQQAGPALELAAVAGEAGPRLGTYAVGDDVTVRIISPAIPGGFEVPGRLAEVEVDATLGNVSWSVVTSMPAPVAREGLGQRLDRLDSTVTRIFQRNVEVIP